MRTCWRRSCPVPPRNRRTCTCVAAGLAVFRASFWGTARGGVLALNGEPCSRGARRESLGAPRHARARTNLLPSAAHALDAVRQAQCLQQRRESLLSLRFRDPRLFTTPHRPCCCTAPRHHVRGLLLIYFTLERSVLRHLDGCTPRQSSRTRSTCIPVSGARRPVFTSEAE